MAQVLLEYGNGSIPENTNFFQPLAEPLIRVPSLPGITFSIGRKGKSFFDYYDFYLFGIRHDFLFNTNRNVTTARWDEIYQLEGLILEGTNIVQEVSRKQWPGNGSGPSVNYCMLVVCETGNSTVVIFVILAEFISAIIVYLVVEITFRRRQETLRLRKGMNKLILYPDDIEPMKKSKNDESTVGPQIPSQASSCANLSNSDLSNREDTRNAYSAATSVFRTFENTAVFNVSSHSTMSHT
ncbi:hypothetical protein AAHC03_0612 [Spirometra sp. Aus1]